MFIVPSRPDANTDNDHPWLKSRAVSCLPVLRIDWERITSTG